LQVPEIKGLKLFTASIFGVFVMHNVINKIVCPAWVQWIFVGYRKRMNNNI